jgi:D-sedoheptulose 7-phosphate isomerase
MNDAVKAILDELVERYPRLGPCENSVRSAFELSLSGFKRGGRLFTCGNGGSAADAEHVVGELLKGFRSRRPIGEKEAQALTDCLGSDADPFIAKLQGALPAISLTGHPGFSSAYSNDVDPEFTLAQHLFGLGRRGDVLWAFSTSGGSKNVLRAAQLAKAFGIGIVSFTGEGGGQLAKLADVAIRVPEHETFKVQELHLPVYHALCSMLEAHFFG